MTESPLLTTDLCDAHPDKVRIAEPVFTDYGAVRRFHGRIVTVKVFEDNVLVRQALENSSRGEVLVVDGGASTRCALLGDMLAAMASKNGWAGVIVNGCIRDSAQIGTIRLGIKALNTHPLKSAKHGEGRGQVPVRFAGIDFKPGEYLYADEDGLIVSPEKLA